jgi:3-oxoadipate enol-lactonase
MNQRFDGPEDAPVVVLVNALGTDMRMWGDQVPALAEHHRVLRYEMPGRDSIEGLGRDVLALLDENELERVSLCGVSLGGMIALWVASEAPDRIDNLVPCCTSAKIGTPEFWNERVQAIRDGGIDVVVDGSLERWLTPAASDDVVARVREMLLGTDPEQYIACSIAIRDMDLHERLGSIRARTLVVAGADDPSTPPEDGRAIADAIPNARFECLQGVRHLPNIEQPEMFNATLMEHLR